MIDHWSCEDARELSEQAKELYKKFGKGPVFVLVDGETSEAFIADHPIQLSDPVELNPDGIQYASWAHELIDLAADVPQAEAEAAAKAHLLESGFGEWRQTTIRDFFADLLDAEVTE